MGKRSDFRKVILVSLSILVSAFAEESSETHTEPIAYPEECLRECSPNLVEGTERKVSRILNSGCYQLCLNRIKATHPQLLIKKTIQKRIRKELTPNTVCPNSSPAQTVDWSPSVVNVSFKQYENTNHWFTNLSWTPMNDMYGHWTGILIRLVVITNNSAIMFGVNCILHPKNQTFFKINISSYGYRYPDAMYLNVLGFPYSRKGDISEPQIYVPDILNTPTSPPPFTTVKIKDPNRTTVYAVSISIGILIGIALVVSLLKCSVCHKKTFLLPRDFEYHAFIIYNHEDSSWVITKLLPLLEDKHHLKCCVHYRDFPPGKPFQETMAETVYKSCKIIAVLSSNFLESNYCNYELTLAKYRLLKKGDDSLIMIRIDEADSKKLPRELRKRNFIDYYNLLERPFWEEKLLKFLDVENDDFSNQSATIQQNIDDNNNSNNDSIIMSANFGGKDFDRLNSTTSNNTQISVVSQINEEELII